MHENRRVEYIDIAKFIAMSCVIFGHRIPHTGALFWPFHLPIFFIIAGMFLSQENDFTGFIVKRFRSLIVPYYFTCLLICVLSIPLAKAREYSIKAELIKWIIASLYGLGHNVVMPNGIEIPQIGAIWFLWAMFFSVIIVRLVIIAGKTVQAVAVFMLPVVAIYSVELFWMPLSIQAACFAVPFIYAGYVYKTNKKSIKTFYNDNMTITILLCVLVAIWGYANYNRFSINKCIMGNGVMDIVVFCISIFIHKYINLIAKPCEMFGRMTIVMLSIHIIEMNLVQWNSVIRFLGLPEGKGSKAVIAMVSYCMILTITYIFSRIPIIANVYGIRSDDRES